VVIIVIGIVFGVIMKFWDDLYSVVKALLPTLRQLIYGMWFMVGPFAALLIRKPGAALLASVAGASLSALVGSGFEVLMYGLIHGLGAELVFLALLSRKFSIAVAGLAGIMSCGGGFLLDLSYGYAEFESWALIVKFGLRAISAF